MASTRPSAHGMFFKSGSTGGKVVVVVGAGGDVLGAVQGHMVVVVVEAGGDVLGAVRGRMVVVVLGSTVVVVLGTGGDVLGAVRGDPIRKNTTTLYYTTTL